MRFLAFATVKCGGRDPFALEEWQRGCPSGNVVGTGRFWNGVTWLATDGCFGMAPSAVEGGRSPFRISAKAANEYAHHWRQMLRRTGDEERPLVRASTTAMASPKMR